MTLMRDALHGEGQGDRLPTAAYTNFSGLREVTGVADALGRERLRAEEVVIARGIGEHNLSSR